MLRRILDAKARNVPMDCWGLIVGSDIGVHNLSQNLLTS